MSTMELLTNYEDEEDAGSDQWWHNEAQQSWAQCDDDKWPAEQDPGYSPTRYTVAVHGWLRKQDPDTEMLQGIYESESQVWKFRRA